MRILIVRNNSNLQAVEASVVLKAWLESEGLGCECVNTKALNVDAAPNLDDPAAAPPADLVVALGGDGTVLRAARCVSPWGTPILGINFGHLGFLANSADCGVVASVAQALADECVAERRANLRISLTCADGSTCVLFALNECAAQHGVSGKVVDFGLSISDARIARFAGDGLVVASPTGATGYALSAGGPLVSPELRGMVVVPLAVHTLKSRPVVTAGSDVVELDLAENDNEVEIYVDGDRVALEAPVRHASITLGAVPTTLLRSQNESYYERLARVFF